MKTPDLITITKTRSKHLIANTWNVMKVIIEKSKIRNDKYPKSVDINKEEITDKNIIAETFNKFKINVGSNLSGKIQPKF